MKQGTLWAFMGAGEEDGLMALGDSPETMRPMVTISPEVRESYEKIADVLAKKTGRKIRLVEFYASRHVKEFGP